LTGVPERPFEIQPDRAKIAPRAAFAFPRRSALGVGDVGSTMAAPLFLFVECAISAPWEDLER
jgi:hypothetical protein